MNARTQTRSAALVAMALTLALTASVAGAAPPSGASERAKSAACRTVETYSLSAWVVPATVVLHSAGAWKQWNKEMAENGLAVAEEAVPANVDWNKEAVVVVALGELSEARHLKLASSRREANGVHLTVALESGSGGNAPALVLAMSKNSAQNLVVSCDAVALPEVRTYPESQLAGGAGDPSTVLMSWGSLKAEYR